MKNVKLLPCLAFCLCAATLAAAEEKPAAAPAPGGANKSAFAIDREKKYDEVLDEVKERFKKQKRNYTWADFLVVLDELGNRERYVVRPGKDFAATAAPEKIVIYMRHDIDHDPVTALRMAKEENARGIKASYYVLPTALYYGQQGKTGVKRYACMDKLYLELQALGHEVGVHNDLLSMMLLWDIDPVVFQQQELEYYKQAGINIVGAVSHGSAVVMSRKLNNTWLFSEFEHVGNYEHEGRLYAYGKLSYKDFGFAYEGYKNSQNKHYGDIYGIKGGAGFVEKLRACQPGDRVSLLTHPIHWGESPAEAAPAGAAAADSANVAPGIASTTEMK